ncbi:hypothetical protein V8E51_012021 [Hyaloscypha variabilis]
MSQPRNPQSRQNSDMEPDIMIISHPPAEWNNFRNESSRGQLLRDLIENGKMDPAIARKQVGKDFAKRGYKLVKPPPPPASPEPSDASLPVGPKPSQRKTRKDPSPASTRAPSSTQQKSATRRSRRDPSPPPPSRSERNKSPHRPGARFPAPYASSTSMVEHVAPRPSNHSSSHRDSRRRRSPSPSRTYSPSPPRHRNRNPSSYSSPSRARSPSPTRSSKPDAESQWRRDMEKEARGDVPLEQQSEWAKQMPLMEDYWARHGYLKPPHGTTWLKRFSKLHDWLDDNRRVVQRYGPGPSMHALMAAIPGGPTLEQFRAKIRWDDELEEKMARFEREGAEEGYSVPSPGTSMEERTRLMREWIRDPSSRTPPHLGAFEAEAVARGYRPPPAGTAVPERMGALREWRRFESLRQQSGQGPAMGNSHSIGGGGPQQYGPSPSMGNPYGMRGGYENPFPVPGTPEFFQLAREIKADVLEELDRNERRRN